MDSSNRQEMTLIACRVLVIFIWISTLTRPILVELNAIFVFIGVFEGIIALVLYGVVRSELLGRAAPVIASMSLPLMALPLMLISGGVNSPISVVLPIYPFYATLLMGKRFCWITTIFLCVCMLPLAVLSEQVIDVNQMYSSMEESFSRAFWIIASLILAASVSNSFGRLADKLSETLREEANMDYLTRIANRRGLENTLARETRNAQRYDSWLSVILLDIDNFKEFNDNFGHLSGDEYLKKISSIIRNASRSRQDFVGRWGGEEFLIILSDTDPVDAENIAELIRREIECMEHDDERKSVTATLGCCSAVGRSARSAKMIESADQALYEGKAAGRNKVVVRQLEEPSELVNPMKL